MGWFEKRNQQLQADLTKALNIYNAGQSDYSSLSLDDIDFMLNYISNNKNRFRTAVLNQNILKNSNINLSTPSMERPLLSTSYDLGILQKSLNPDAQFESDYKKVLSVKGNQNRANALGMSLEDYLNSDVYKRILLNFPTPGKKDDWKEEEKLVITEQPEDVASINTNSESLPRYVSVGTSGSYGNLYYDTQNNKRVYKMNNSTEYKDLPKSYSWDDYEKAGYNKPASNNTLGLSWSMYTDPSIMTAAGYLSNSDGTTIYNRTENSDQLASNLGSLGATALSLGAGELPFFANMSNLGYNNPIGFLKTLLGQGTRTVTGAVRGAKPLTPELIEAGNRIIQLALIDADNGVNLATLFLRNNPELLEYGLLGYKKGGMIKRFQQGGKLELIMLMFMLDLGAALGALSELEALQTGLAAVLKMGKEKALLVFQAWGQAELQLQGGGRKVLAKMLQGGSQAPSMNQNPVMSARQGALLRFAELNGKCPEGYEVEKYLAGGCVKCRKGKKINKSLTEELKCGGKKRFAKKNDDGWRN